MPRPGDPHYAHEKFTQVMLQLATDEDDLKTRLYDALAGPIVAVSDDDFPTQELREEYRKFRDEVSRVAAVGNEGAYKATIRTMDRDEVKRHLHTIVSLYDGLLRAMGDIRP